MAHRTAVFILEMKKHTEELYLQFRRLLKFCWISFRNEEMGLNKYIGISFQTLVCEKKKKTLQLPFCVH